MKKLSQHGKITEVLETACIESRYYLTFSLYEGWSLNNTKQAIISLALCYNIIRDV